MGKYLQVDSDFIGCLFYSNTCKDMDIGEKGFKIVCHKKQKCTRSV